MIGSILADRWEIQRHLGDGAIASVWQARDRTLGVDVAIKLLHPHLARDEAAVERARREVLASRRVAGAVAAHELVTTAEAVFLVQELCPGGDLAQRLMDGPMPEPDVLAVGQALARMLQGAHSAGVMHRDVKPANILFDAHGQPRLGDFGLARLADRAGNTATSLLAGTVGFAAPEVYDGVLDDPRTDQYALAATLFEAATGAPPWAGFAPAVAMRRQAVDEAPAAKGVSAAFAAVLARGLARRPEARFGSMAAFAEALAGAAEGKSPVQAAIATGRVCAGCKEPLVPGLGVCPACGRAAAVVTRSDGPYSVRVFVKRKRVPLGVRFEQGGFNGRDALTFTQKQALVNTVTDLTGDYAQPPENLDLALRHPVIVAADGLDRASAELIRGRLAADGLDSAVIGPGASLGPARWWQVYRAAVLQFLLVPVGIIFSAINLSNAHSLPSVVLPILGTSFVAALIQRRYQPRALLCPPGTSGSTVAPAFSAEVAERFKALRDRSVRDLLGDVLRAASELRLALADAPAIVQQDGNVAIGDAVDHALTMGAHLDTLCAVRPPAARGQTPAERLAVETEAEARESQGVRLRGDLLALASSLRGTTASVVVGQGAGAAAQAEAASERLRGLARAMREVEGRR